MNSSSHFHAHCDLFDMQIFHEQPKKWGFLCTERETLSLNIHVAQSIQNHFRTYFTALARVRDRDRGE